METKTDLSLAKINEIWGDSQNDLWTIEAVTGDLVLVAPLYESEDKSKKHINTSDIGWYRTVMIK